MPLINPINYNKQIGMGLIESLVALLIISVGLMGIAALQITSLKQTSSAQWHSQAVWFSYEMTDRIAANRSALAQYDGTDTDTVDNNVDCQANPCSVDDMAKADQQAWKDLVSTLPGGRGIISSSGDTLNVSVMWDEGIDKTNCTNGEPSPEGKTCYTVTIQ